MLPSLKYAAAALALSASAALAAGEPWSRAAPRDMTPEHQQYAAQAKQVKERQPGGSFGFDPMTTTWRGERGRTNTHPVSNMSRAATVSALTGRYHVYKPADQNAWSVRYFAPDGTTYFCEPQGRGRYREFRMDRYVAHTPFGLYGTMHWDSNKESTATPPASERWAWPSVANPKTGEYTTYTWWRGEWHAETGWLQDDYAAVWAEKCPQLPRSASVNNRQSGETLNEIARGARAYRGMSVAFPNDPRDPLTAGMFYHLYPPQGAR